MKSGFVAIVGRPSCGKSTFINAVCGHKVSIVTPIPQTTRNKVRGIYTSEDKTVQLVFIDTPGFHTSGKKFNTYMKNLIQATIDESDVICYMIDISRDIGEEERAVMSIVSSFSKPVVIVLNKIDKKRNFLPVISGELERIFPDTPCIQISALEKKGLTGVLDHLTNSVPEGDLYYPDEFYTDQPPEFRIAEIIREKAMSRAKQELPHCIYIEILDMEMHDDNKVLWVRGFIYVERESQKGILIGKGGEKIKQIMQDAQAEIAELFPYLVDLDFRVKVQPKWRKKDHIIRRLVQ
jgi:GTPase